MLLRKGSYRSSRRASYNRLMKYIFETIIVVSVAAFVWNHFVSPEMCGNVQQEPVRTGIIQ